MNATNLNRLLHLAALLAAIALLSDAKASTLLTQVDDFSTGVQGWNIVGEVVADGGRAGAGDAYLSYSSSGSGGSQSRMVIPNESSGNQWSGDFVAAGVTGFEMDVQNSGASQLDLRIGIANGSTWFVSSDAVQIAPGTGWNSVAFQVDAASMTGLGGSDAFETVAADVQRMRIFSSVNLPSVAPQGGVRGDQIAATIGVDNITAVGVPEPASALMGLLTLAAAAVGRRQV